MSIIDRIIDGYFKRKGLNPNGYDSRPLLPINAYTISQFSKNDWVGAYQSSADLYAVASFLIRKAACIPWFVYRKNEGSKAKAALERYKQLSRGLGHKGAYEAALMARKAAFDENEIVEDSALSMLLKRPNERQGQDSFFESVFGYRVLSGEANIWVNTGDPMDTKGVPVEMQVLPTQFMDIYADPADVYGILGYRLQIGGGVNIAKENNLMWKNWRPEFNADTRIHLRGISPVQVAWNTYNMGNNASESVANMLKNGGARGALTPVATGTMPPPSMTQEQVDAASKSVNDRFNGNRNAGNIGVLARQYDYLNFGLSAVDMAVIDTMKLSLHQWCRVLGLPTVLFDSDHTSDNNYQNAMRDLVTNTNVPMMASLRDELNRWLVPRFGDTGLFIDFDIQGLPELQRDQEKLVNSLKAAYWLTEDEKRVAMNYEPKGGIYDRSLVPMGLTPIDNVGMDTQVDQSENVGQDNVPY